MDSLQNRKGNHQLLRYVVDNLPYKRRYGGFWLTRKGCAGILSYRPESLITGISCNLLNSDY